MKKALFYTGVLIALGLLSRLPHPAMDIAKLAPVRTVCIYIEDGLICVETDTGDCGSGLTLEDAAGDMKNSAAKSIYLDTAEFLLLDSAVSVNGALYEMFRPDCRVVYYIEGKPDLAAASEYLAAHKSELTLAKLRAQNQTEQEGAVRSWTKAKSKIDCGF